MQPLLDKQNKARVLRKKGYSLNEISDFLSISKSSASIWVKDCKLSKKAVLRIGRRRTIGYENAKKSKKLKAEKIRESLRLEADNFFKTTNVSKKHLALFCALLYRCEGNKDARGGIKFTNSDPVMIRSFIDFLKSYFEIDEKKLRACVHLHEYHSPKKQILFWSKVTGIPKVQFNRPYIKPHTGKRKKVNYPGCICISYGSALLAKRLIILSEVIFEKYGGVG